MALISNKQETPKHKLKAQIDVTVAEEMQRYCDWAGVDVNFFIEEAARYIFRKDRDWRSHSRKPGQRGRKSRNAPDVQSA